MKSNSLVITLTFHLSTGSVAAAAIAASATKLIKIFLMMF